MRPAEPGPSLRQAVALGLLQGPAELLPISSSAHTSLLPWLLAPQTARADAGRRKSLEVALHGGAAAALAIVLGPALAREGSRLGARGTAALALAAVPPALAGLALRGVIERRLGGPRTIAAGLAAGAAAMALADARPSRRSLAQTTMRDGLALGLAQALALAPGVSRNGATLAAARWRGFDRSAAASLSWLSGLPVLAGASTLELARAAKARGRGSGAGTLAGGALAAFASSAASARLLAPLGRGRRLLGFALYRLALATLVLVRLRRAQ